MVGGGSGGRTLRRRAVLIRSSRLRVRERPLWAKGTSSPTLKWNTATAFTDLNRERRLPLLRHKKKPLFLLQDCSIFFLAQQVFKLLKGSRLSWTRLTKVFNSKTYRLKCPIIRLNGEQKHGRGPLMWRGYCAIPSAYHCRMPSPTSRLL